jgi:hypothetical protein
MSSEYTELTVCDEYVAFAEKADALGFLSLLFNTAEIDPGMSGDDLEVLQSAIDKRKEYLSNSPVG